MKFIWHKKVFCIHHLRLCVFRSFLAKCAWSTSALWHKFISYCRWSDFHVIYSQCTHVLCTLLERDWKLQNSTIQSCSGSPLLLRSNTRRSLHSPKHDLYPISYRYYSDRKRHKNSDRMTLNQNLAIPCYSYTILPYSYHVWQPSVKTWQSISWTFDIHYNATEVLMSSPVIWL